ncbi:RecX family transcriptional regulator [Candidatus Poribacteria bacterium]|nr:RecX family transcriptional regulator [Candidatus Poribacteria bacterium]
MPIIQTIKSKGSRSTRRIIKLAGVEAPVELDSEVLARTALAEGQNLADERLAELIREDQQLLCRRRAWALLARRPYGQAELVRALRRAFPAEVAHETAASLADAGHLDDRASARLYASQTLGAGTKGPRLVRQQLRVRGIKREDIEAAVQPLEDAESQRAAARALLLKWNRRSKPEELHKRAQAAAGHLLRRGFDPELVWELVREVVLAGGADSQ